MKNFKVIGWVLVVSFLWTWEGAFSPSQVLAAENLSADAWFENTAETFYWAYLDARPNVGVRLGYHQYDGRLPNVSPDALDKEKTRLKESLRIFESIDRAKLSAVHQIERDVILFKIRSELFGFETLRSPWRNPIFYNRAVSVLNYISRDYKSVEARARAIIAVAEGIGRFLGDAQANLDKEIPRPWLETALLQVKGNLEFVQNDIKPAMAELEDPVAKELEAAIGKMAKALEKHKAFLETRQAQATDAYALGEETFLRMLAQTQGVKVDLKTLEAIAQADLERNLKALSKATQAMDPDKPTREVVAMVLADKPSVSGILNEAQRQATQMRQFLLDHDIVTIPSNDLAEARATPPFMRWNFAFLDSAGPFEEKSLPSFYYISPPDPQWSKEEQKAYIPGKTALLAVTIHEVWPGHFLHFLHAKQLDSVFLKSFGNYATVEGWAHYTEEMMWQAGVGNKDPRVHIGQLGNALLRNVRFISAIGLHTKGMTVEESKQLFEDQALQDPGNARQQAVRGTFDPMYLSYTLGKLMIMKLHEDWKAKMGDAYSLKAFHNTFLSYGLGPGTGNPSSHAG